MEKYLNKVLIVDGSYFLHRALKTPGFADLATKSGIKSGGVFGFMKMFQAECKKFSGYFPIVCWDDGLSKRRTDCYPDYKANRKRQTVDGLKASGVTVLKDEFLKEYHSQRDALIRILKSFGIPSLLLPGWEGDDLQYLLSLVCKDGVILTDDKDMIQLVSPTIRIRRCMRDELIVWDENDTYYRHPRFTIRKTIIGDDSDNIPHCVNGIGEKTADKIAMLIEDKPFDEFITTLSEYAGNNKDALSKKIQLLLSNWQQFVINWELINLHLVEFPVGFDTIVKDRIKGMAGKSNMMESYKFLGMYELNSIFPDQIIQLVNNASKNIFVEE